jgi:hypothetical protein
VPITAPDATHTRAVLGMVWTHLIVKYNDALAPYRADVLQFLAGCCGHAVPAIRDFALACLEDFVVSGEAAFRGPLLALLLRALADLVPGVTTAVRFVELIGQLIALFAELPEAVAALMAVLADLSRECERIGSAEVDACWCAARGMTFTNLVAQNSADKVAAHLRESLALFAKFQTVGHWNALVVELLVTVRAVDGELFGKCCTAAMREICLLIETESKEVRSTVVEILRRRLGE